MINEKKPEYKVFLYRGGIQIAQLVEYRSLRFGYERNGYQELNFEHNGNGQPNEITNGLTTGSEIRIERKGIGEAEYRLIYAAEIISRNRKINAKNVKTYTVRAKPWEHLLEKAFVTGVFGSQDESALAWAVINDVQTDTSAEFPAAAADLGFDQGTLETTGNTRTWTYAAEEVFSVLARLADLEDQVTEGRVRGFRFSPDLTDASYRVFSYFGTFGVRRPTVIYTNQLIEEIDYLEDIDGFSNKVNTIGSDGTIKTASNADTVANTFWKKRETFLSKSNIETLSILQDAADDELTVRSQTPTDKLLTIKTVQNDPFIGKYRVGDEIAVAYTDDDGFLDVAATVKVYKIEIEYDGKGKEQATITFAITKPTKIVTNPIARLKELFKEINLRLINAER